MSKKDLPVLRQCRLAQVGRGFYVCRALWLIADLSVA
jgi:hypothetical protein